MSHLLKKIQATQTKNRTKISLPMPTPIVVKKHGPYFRTKVFIYITSLILGILLACFFLKEDNEFHLKKLSKDFSAHIIASPNSSIQTDEITFKKFFSDSDMEISKDQIPLAISIEPMVLDETEILNRLSDNSTLIETEESPKGTQNDCNREIISPVISETKQQENIPETLPIEFEKKLSHSIKPIASKIASLYNTSLNLSSNFIETNIKNLQDRLQTLSKFKQKGLSIDRLKGLVNSSNNTKEVTNLVSLTTKKNPRSNILSKISHLNAHQQKHLTDIYNFLRKFRIDGVRLDGINSRIHANGYAYHVNTFVSHHPALKLTGITQNELIFRDEHNQEYRKEISQND